MSGSTTDAMIQRLEKEIEERSAVIEGVVGSAQDAGRDLTQNEKELAASARGRIETLDEQLVELRASSDRMASARKRAADVQNELTRMRKEVDTGPVEYRSAGHYYTDYVA